MVVGFEFTFDAFQWCHQIYNLFAYSFDLGEGEVKYETIMTSPLTYVKEQTFVLNFPQKMHYPCELNIDRGKHF